MHRAAPEPELRTGRRERLMEEILQDLVQGRPADALARLQGPPGIEDEAAARIAARQLAEAYRAFALHAVTGFCQGLRGAVPAERIQDLIAELGPLVERTRHWSGKLEDVTRERLVREARAGVTLDDIALAEARITALIARGASPEEKAKLIRYAVQGLGRMARDSDRVVRLFTRLAESGVFPADGPDWKKGLAGAQEAARHGGFEESNHEWTRIRTEAVVALRAHVPGRGAVGEPTPEEQTRFNEEAMAVMRAGFAGGDDSLIDAINVLTDYCPADPPAYESVAGAEARLFLDLSPRGKLTAVRGLGAMGEYPILRARVAELARSDTGGLRTEEFATIMGGLRHSDFSPWLVARLHAAKKPSLREAILDALSRISGPEAIEILLDEFRQRMKKASKPEFERAASQALEALSRVVRTKGAGAEARNRIISEVISLVDRRNGPLPLEAAKGLFQVKLGELDRESRVWAVRTLARSLYAVDTGRDLKSSRDNKLGFRKPLVAALTRLGREFLPELIEEASLRSTEYSGALEATAELLTKVGDESALPLLERMARTAFNARPDEIERMYLLKEKFHDAATGEMRDLNPDDVLLSILYAIEKIGGEAGLRLLLRFADEIRTGRLPTPGENSASLLMKARRNAGSLPDAPADADPSAEPGADVSDEEVSEALAKAKGGIFGGGRKQIEGLVVLGRALRVESLDVILPCLGSKDAMVQAAAETALSNFFTPVPERDRFRRIVTAIFECASDLKEPALVRLIAFVRRAFPRQKPYVAAYRKALAAALEEGELRFRLDAALPESAPPPKGAAAVADDGGDSEAGADDKAAGGHISELEKKREYLRLRREWIDGGKRGPAPEPS